MSNGIIYFKNYLSYFLVVLGLQWCTGLSPAAESGGCSLVVVCEAFLVEHRFEAYKRFSSYSIWVLVVMHGLRCFTACGIFLDQDSNMLPALASGFLAIVSPAKSPMA